MKKLFLGVSLAALFIAVYLLVPKSKPETVNITDLINEATEETGFIGEKIIENPETAKVVVFEYADYGCPHCSDYNRLMNNLLEKYNGEIALVFRGYNLKFKNGLEAAKAATAAQIQGYFKEYKDLLFQNQAEWGNEEGEDVEKIFLEYFKKASKIEGDLDKFLEDYRSEAVEKRLAFEQDLGNKIKLKGTPTFRIGGKNIKLENLLEQIEEKIRE